MTTALRGIRVLDLTNGVAGNSAAKLLADLGAEVIKVESPGRGDFTRTLVPWVFESFNRNKKSVAIDLRRADGLELVHRLLSGCDVFLCSLRPGAADALGLSATVLGTRYPRLIRATLSGFGATGPYRDRKAVDVVVQAESALWCLQGRVMPNTSFIDVSAGLNLVTAVMAALLERERTGVIEHVTVTLLDSALYLETAPLAEYSATATVIDAAAYARRFPAVSVFEAADGPMFVAAYWNEQWATLCAVVGRPDLVEDSRFSTQAARSDHVEPLRREIEAGLRTGARADWIARLTERGVIAGAANSFADVLADPQVAENASVETVELADGRAVSFVVPAFRFVGRPWPASSRAPELGGDTAAVLAELGVSDDDLEHLARTGVIAYAGVPA